jgi:hypothetical protein
VGGVLAEFCRLAPHLHPSPTARGAGEYPHEASAPYLVAAVVLFSLCEAAEGSLALNCVEGSLEQVGITRPPANGAAG